MPSSASTTFLNEGAPALRLCVEKTGTVPEQGAPHAPRRLVAGCGAEPHQQQLPSGGLPTLDAKRMPLPPRCRQVSAFFFKRRGAAQRGDAESRFASSSTKGRFEDGEFWGCPAPPRAGSAPPGDGFFLTQSGGSGRRERFASWSGKGRARRGSFSLRGSAPRPTMPRTAFMLFTSFTVEPPVSRGGWRNREPQKHRLPVRPLIRGMREAKRSAAPAAPCVALCFRTQEGGALAEPSGSSEFRWRRENSDERNPSANAPGLCVALRRHAPGCS